MDIKKLEKAEASISIILSVLNDAKIDAEYYDKLFHELSDKVSRLKKENDSLREKTMSKNKRICIETISTRDELNNKSYNPKLNSFLREDVERFVREVLDLTVFGVFIKTHIYFTGLSTVKLYLTIEVNNQIFRESVTLHNELSDKDIIFIIFRKVKELSTAALLTKDDNDKVISRDYPID